MSVQIACVARSRSTGVVGKPDTDLTHPKPDGILPLPLHPRALERRSVTLTQSRVRTDADSDAAHRSVSLVVLARVRDQVADTVGRAMEAARWRDAIPRGAHVALKPNLGWDLFLPGAVTSPGVLEGVIRKLREWVDRISIVEADQVLVSCERALRQTGTDQLCRLYGVDWINLSAESFQRVSVANALAAPEIEVPEILLRTTLVTVPVMKTHAKTTLSGAVKNQWGCLPKFRHNYHPVVDEVLRDLSLVLRPAFTVLDATVALEGNGPKSGTPRIMNMVLASSDPVAVDSVSARIMGLDPGSVRHLRLCAEAGIGCLETARIEVSDENGRAVPDIPVYPFRRAADNPISSIETRLRGIPGRKLVFETRLLQVFCLGARLWYWIWYYVGPGRSRRRRALSGCPGYWGSVTGR
jgi:uncharacterized protein (DUF362 family)